MGPQNSDSHGSLYGIVKDGKRLQPPGPPGSQDVKVSEERYVAKTNLTTAVDQFVRPNEKSYRGEAFSEVHDMTEFIRRTETFKAAMKETLQVDSDQVRTPVPG